MAKEPITPPAPSPAEPSKPPAEEPGKPYPVENPPEPHPNEDQPLVDPVPPEKDLPRMQERAGRGTIKSGHPVQPDGAPDHQPGAVRGT